MTPLLTFIYHRYILDWDRGKAEELDGKNTKPAEDEDEVEVEESEVEAEEPEDVTFLLSKR